MTRATPLGDPHNFGRRVERRGTRVVKPRTVFWEWLMLGRDSPLRRLLRQAGEAAGLGRDVFGFVPSLRFYEGRGGVGGEVEQVSLEPLRARSAAKRRELALVVGRSLALWSWLGAADLHWENLVLGEDAKGNIVFGPLDVEMLLGDLASPAETKLLPDADPEYAVVCQHAAGVRRVLPYLGKPVQPGDLLAMAAAYVETLSLLDQQASAIAKLLGGLPGLRDEPLRVLLRGTEEYVAQSDALWPPLLGAERQQLERGDVPYFFRLYGRRGILFYGDASLSRLERLPLKGDVPQLEPLLDVSKGLRAPSRGKLRDEGLFALLGAFDHPDITGEHVTEQLSVTFGARGLTVERSGEILKSPRNLRHLVSSVYLPCRCGEVRSVFVPAVTVCQSARGNV